MISEALHCISDDLSFYLSTSNIFREHEEDWREDLKEECGEFWRKHKNASGGVLSPATPLEDFP